MATFSIEPVRDELGVKPGQLLVGGRWLEAASARRLEAVHPATGEATTTIAAGAPADVDAAVRAARRAFEEGPWPALDARERRQLCLRIAAAIDSRREELNRLQTLDNGMPIVFSAIYQVSAEILVDLFEYYAGWVDKCTGETIPAYPGQIFDFTLREPVGVVGAIIPWNAPLILCGLKLAPALAMGNTVVLKPSELASLCALRIGAILTEAGLPDGVVNVVTGTGSDAGRALVAHPGVDKITFTGGTETGKEIMRVAADSLKRVSLELGGKSANVIFADAPNLDLAVGHAVGAIAMGLSGQGCACVTRALVEESIYDAFVEKAFGVMDLVRPGNPFDMTTTAGPIISPRQLERVLGYIETGKSEGARLLRGGQRLDGELAGGNFVAATLFGDVRNDMTIAREEIFGPVLSVIRFRDVDEAIRIANDSHYGLAGQVWTRDLNKALTVARRVRTGTMGVNGYGVIPTAPFGGYKRSGFGREGGRESLDLFTEVKNVWVDLGVGS
ncbi:MAG: aldehyde dehydrogenase family protein [Candidatus Binatia bacterium]